MDLWDLAWALMVSCVFALPLGLTLWALLDAARRPQWAWALVGRRQVVWIAAILLGTFTVVGGLIICTWYLTRVRVQIAAAEEGEITG